MGESLSERGYAIDENLFSDSEVTELFSYLNQLINEDDLRQAGIGAGADFTKDKKVRGDKIFWIQENHLPDNLGFWANFTKQLITFLNTQFYVGVRDSEFHFAFYPKGTYYEKHLDQFKGRNNRLISCILYLNKHWQPGDGGELVLYLNDGEQLAIEPTFGKFVCFRSEIFPHEVLTTQTNRYSLTGWLLNYPRGLGFLGY